MSLCYIDTETTGLGLVEHDVWEIAYAFDDEPIQVGIVAHRNDNADPQALAINRYNQREIHPSHAVPGFEHDLRDRLEDVRPTIVGANPSFDAYRLSRRWNWKTPWRYRFVDVSSLAIGVLGHDRPKGLDEIAAELTERGWEVTAPNHSAAADVAAVRDVHRILMAMRGNEA